MIQNVSSISHWLLKNEYRKKAEIRYQIKQLESQFNIHFNTHCELNSLSAEIHALSQELVSKYLEYLKLIDNQHQGYFEFTVIETRLNWQKKYRAILILKEQLYKTQSIEDECSLIKKIATLYHNFQEGTKKQLSSITLNKNLEKLNQLFNENELQSWLHLLVRFWNEQDIHNLALSSLFHEWTSQQKQSTLDFFAQPGFVNLVNALFFYKLYPDKLFDDLIHPEKLVSIRMRIGVLHQFIEQLKSQLSSIAIQYGLKPKVDYLFHGDELPDGIMIEVNEEFREMIQLAIKELKVKYTSESEEQERIDRLHDLGRAYKFWFNPNRLIDAVMVLQQRLVVVADENKLLSFYHEMVVLYSHLTTTECLDLYGYFSNNDTRYLLYTLFSIENNYPLDWLPELNYNEQNAITLVFEALQCVIEALREELKNRHVTTEPYIYDLAKKRIQPGRRNRDAVFRIIDIYGGQTFIQNEAVEQLFNFIEDRNR